MSETLIAYGALSENARATASPDCAYATGIYPDARHPDHRALCLCRVPVRETFRDDHTSNVSGSDYDSCLSHICHLPCLPC